MTHVYAIFKGGACFWQAGIFLDETAAQAYVDEANKDYYEQLAQIAEYNNEDFAVPPPEKRAYYVQRLNWHDGVDKNMLQDGTITVVSTNNEESEVNVPRVYIPIDWEQRTWEVYKQLAATPAYSANEDKWSFIQQSKAYDLAVKIVDTYRERQENLSFTLEGEV